MWCFNRFGAVLDTVKQQRKIKKMKRLLWIFLLGTTQALALQGDSTNTPSTPTAFEVGEYLKYRVHYGIIDAGIAELEVHGLAESQGRVAYKVSGKGRSVGLFSWFFEVKDYYESYIDTQQLVPLEFIRDVREGGYKAKEHAIFDPENQLVYPKKEPKDTMRVPFGVQDLLSSFYYARNLDFSDLKYGDEFPIVIYLNQETFPMNLKYVGKDEIKTDFGTFRCLSFRPMLQEGRVFKEEEGMTIWISDDENRIPVRVETEVLVGSIKMDLIGFKGINKPLNKY